MTSQQRAVIGMGETISKVGVGRGWWVADVATEPSGGERRSEPVYSLAVEGDGLWTLTGTQVSPYSIGSGGCVASNTAYSLVWTDQSLHLATLSRSPRTFTQRSYERCLLHESDDGRETRIERFMGRLDTSEILWAGLSDPMLYLG